MARKAQMKGKRDEWGEGFETEIRILPDGTVVILDLDEAMLEIALALDPNNRRLRQRRRLLSGRGGRCHESGQNR